MGANDAAEMLEAAQAECVRLERVNAELREKLEAAEENAGWARIAADSAQPVQQPNRDELIEAVAPGVCQSGGHIPNRDRSLPGSCSLHRSMAAGYVDAVLAALAVPATGEVEWGTQHPAGDVWPHESREIAEEQSRSDGSTVVSWTRTAPQLVTDHRLDDEQGLCQCPSCLHYERANRGGRDE